MPNWCSTDYIIHGPEDKVKKAYELMNDFLDNPALTDGYNPTAWLGNIVAGLGKSTEGIPCRGWINFIEKPTNSKQTYPEEWSFYVSSEDAWCPQDDAIIMLVDHVNSSIPGDKDLDFDYVAEEPGCEIYLNTDTTKRYFPIGFHISFDGDRFDYTEMNVVNKQELIRAINKFLIKDFSTNTELCDIMNYVEEYNLKMEEEGDDDVIYIHEYKTL